jgi:hypothetical protein
MSALRHSRFSSNDDTTYDGMPATRHAHRLRRVLGVLVVAVALPAAFASSQAAARTSPEPVTTAPTETNAAACAALTDVLGGSDACDVQASEDISGRSVEQQLPTRSQAPSTQASKLLAVYGVYLCHPIGGGWYHCHLIGVLIVFDNTTRAIGEQAPTDSGEQPTVRNP